MKKFYFFALAYFFCCITINGQITKKNWLVGGNGSLSSQIEDLNGTEVRGIDIKISPAIGYFFIDKFAGGLSTNLIYSNVKFNGGVSKSTRVGIGPFLRYYFLHTDKRVNLLAETAYQHVFYNSNSGGSSDKENIFSFSAGPVIYFNSSVGIEFTGKYEIDNSRGRATSAKTFYLSIGFQIHLEKDHNQ